MSPAAVTADRPPATTSSNERAALIVIFAGVCAALHVGKLPPAIPALQAALGLSLVQAGFLLSLVQLAGMCAGVAFGVLADGLGLRRSLMLGLGVLALASAAGGFATGAGGLMVLRALEGFGFLLVVLPAPGLVRQNRYAPVGKHLQAIDMVGVVVGDDDVADFFVRHPGNLGQQPLGQRGRAQGVNHHHAAGGDDEAGVGDKVLVRGRAQGRQAFYIPAAWRRLARLHGGRGRRFVSRFGVTRPVAAEYTAQAQAGAALQKLASARSWLHDVSRMY